MWVIYKWRTLGLDFGLDCKCPLALSNYILQLKSDKQETSSSVVKAVSKNLVSMMKNSSLSLFLSLSLIPTLMECIIINHVLCHWAIIYSEVKFMVQSAMCFVVTLIKTLLGMLFASLDSSGLPYTPIKAADSGYNSEMLFLHGWQWWTSHNIPLAMSINQQSNMALCLTAAVNGTYFVSTAFKTQSSR